MYGKCRVCGNDHELKHHSIYVNGSEGINICIKCEIKVCEFIRSLQRQSTRDKIASYKDKN